MTGFLSMCAYAALAMSSTAWADGMPAFEEADRDGDTYISRAEAGDIPGLLELFSALDTNGDGRLSRDEYEFVASPTGGPHGSNTI
jgi:Ca2+-binding EF-hand superfamily protein